MDVIDRQDEFEVTLARILRRASMLDPSMLPPAWRRQLETLDARAMAAEVVRRRALARDPLESEPDSP